MDSVIVSDYGVMLAKTGDRLVVRGPKPRLELIEGGPQLFLPFGRDHRRPTLSVVTSNGEKRPAEPLRLSHHGRPNRPPIRSSCHCSASAISWSPPAASRSRRT